MKVGVIFPQTECGTDVAAIAEFVRAVETEGFDHLFVADHVLGADPRFHAHPSLANYSHESVVHEALTSMAYFAAITSRIVLATGILILPQRQTVLVAKQAAEIDVLSGGRLRLGIGVGWNAVEYEALNETFENRGRRAAEQVAVLRALWTQQVVDFRGEFHRIDHAGLCPCPSSGRFPSGSAWAAAITWCRPRRRCGGSESSPTAGARTSRPTPRAGPSSIACTPTPARRAAIPDACCWRDAFAWRARIPTGGPSRSTPGSRSAPPS